jgi:hypothetical protein
MSHANGLVKFSDGEVMHFEYNGTSDLACTALKRTYKELLADWRTERNMAVCRCDKAESVEMATDYGSGSGWQGKACRVCMAITDGIDPDETDDFPEWANGDFYLEND